MESPQQKPFTLGRWIGANFAGWLLGVVLILLLSSFLDSIGIEHMQFYVSLGMGAGVSFTQWRLLKKRIPMGQNWVWYSALAMGAPSVIFDLLPLEMAPFKLQISIACGALCMSFVQYVLLKGLSGKAGLWIFVNFLGWMLAVVTVFSIDYTKQLGFNNLILAVLNLFLILAGGVVLGAVTGPTMKALLQNADVTSK